MDKNVRAAEKNIFSVRGSLDGALENFFREISKCRQKGGLPGPFPGDAGIQGEGTRGVQGAQQSFLRSFVGQRALREPLQATGLWGK